MEFGLNGNNNNVEHQKELLEIEAIYRKYDPNNLYSPLGFASADIKEKKNGWFFDGWPLNATGYANSPQWFSYFCGKSVNDNIRMYKKWKIKMYKNEYFYIP